MRVRNRQHVIDLSRVPGSLLTKAKVEPASDKAIRLLTCTGTRPTGQEVRLGTFLVGFDLAPTPVWSHAGLQLLTGRTARYLLDEVAARLRKNRGIW